MYSYILSIILAISAIYLSTGKLSGSEEKINKWSTNSPLHDLHPYDHASKKRTKRTKRTKRNKSKKK